jgi:hypothetical protein
MMGRIRKSNRGNQAKFRHSDHCVFANIRQLKSEFWRMAEAMQCNQKRAKSF